MRQSRLLHVNFCESECENWLNTSSKLLKNLSKLIQDELKIGSTLPQNWFKMSSKLVQNVLKISSKFTQHWLTIDSKRIKID